MKKQVEQVQKTNYYAYVVLTVVAILYILGIQAIMQVAKALPSGLGSIPLVISLIFHKLAPYYGIMYCVLNIPFILIFWKKIKKKFIIRTVYFLLVSTSFSCIFFDKNISDWFTTLIIHPESGMTLDATVYDKVWPMLVLPVIGGVLVGAAISFSWKYGGSTGGTDFVTYYFSTVHKKQIGFVNFIISLIIVLIMFSVLVSIETDVRDHWLTSLIGSFTYISVSSVVVTRFFPKYSKVQVEIHSRKLPEIIESLRVDFPHAFRVQEATSGFSMEKAEYITTVMLLLELREFMKRIKLIDPEVWTSVINVSSIFGKFNTDKADYI